jgi:hypothetical protein
MRGRLALLAAVTLAVLAVAVVGRPAPTRPAPGHAGPDTTASAPPSPAAPAAPARWAGVNWTRLEDPALDDRDVRFGGLRTDGSRVVAWGHKASEDGVGPPGRREITIVWTSEGGRSWRRQEARLPGGEPFYLGDVNVSAAGFAALGGTGGGTRIATSLDGGEWRVVSSPGDLPGPVFPSAGGLLTVGFGPGPPVVYVSRDGTDWQAIQGPAQPGQYDIYGMARTADGLAIVGAFGDRGNWDGVLWRWTPGGGLVDVGGHVAVFAGPDRSVSLYRVVPHAGGVYIEGSVDVPVPGECAALDGPVAALGPPIADVCGRTDLVWTSPDWVQWQEREDTLPLVSPETLVAGVDGLVALLHGAPGAEDFGAAPSLWTSFDGIEWRRLGAGIPEVTALVALPDKLIAFAPKLAAPEQEVDTGFVVWVGTPR